MYIDPRTKLKAQEMDKIKEYEKKKKKEPSCIFFSLLTGLPTLILDFLQIHLYRA